MPDSIEFWQAGEWTMVYLNGDLVGSGGHYLADEWLQERCGVTVVSDDASHSVPDGHNPIRKLSDVIAARDAATARKEVADAMRAEAQAMLTRATEVELGKS